MMDGTDASQCKQTLIRRWIYALRTSSIMKASRSDHPALLSPWLPGGTGETLLPETKRANISRKAQSWTVNRGSKKHKSESSGVFGFVGRRGEAKEWSQSNPEWWHAV
jgi:hypothetical protein